MVVTLLLVPGCGESHYTVALERDSGQALTFCDAPAAFHGKEVEISRPFTFMWLNTFIGCKCCNSYASWLEVRCPDHDGGPQMAIKLVSTNKNFAELSGFQGPTRFGCNGTECSYVCTPVGDIRWVNWIRGVYDGAARTIDVQEFRSDPIFVDAGAAQ